MEDENWALRMTLDSELECIPLDTERLDRGFTIQAWVRPVEIHRGVTAFGGDRFQGASVDFHPGRYDDLAQFRLTLASMSVPSGFRAILFAETGCTGEARSLDGDVPDLGD
jgi:hypothetical protein